MYVQLQKVVHTYGQMKLYVVISYMTLALLSPRGMQMFFKTHKCGYLCKKLGLKDIGSYKEPTLRCFIPGSLDGT